MSDVLERNLERLFARAWRPPRPEPAFRAALRDAFEERAARFGRARPRRAPLWIAAAAALVVVGIAWRVLGVDAPAPRPDASALLARGDVLWRAGLGAWNAQTPQAGRAELGPRAAPLEVRTPEDAAARVEWSGAALELAPRGALRLESSAGGERAWLAAGALDVDAQGGPLAFGAAPGAVELEAGVARLELEDDALLVVLEGGRARLSDVPAPRAVEGPGRWRLRDGRVLEPAPALGDARRGVPEPEVEPQVEPEAPAEGPFALRGVVRAGEHAVRDFRVVALPAVPLPTPAMPTVFEFSDPEGRFALPVLEEFDYTLFVLAPGFAVWRSRPLRLDLALEEGAEAATLAVELDEGLSVHGTVWDAEGAPLAGVLVLSERDAPVAVLPLDREALLEEFDFVRHAVSDADGRYVLEHVARGEQVLRACGGGQGVAWIDGLEVTGSLPLAGVDLTLPPGGTIGGRVFDGDGLPRVGALVLVSGADFARQRPTLSYRATEVDGEGRYELDGLPAGSLAVLLFAKGTSGPDNVPDMRLVSVRAGQRLEVDFLTRRQGAGLEGRLLEQDGRPLIGRAVWIEQTVGGSGPESLVSATTDAEGRFVFENLKTGVLDVYVAGLLPTELAMLERIELAPGEVLRREFRAGSEHVAGRLVAQDGTPVSGALVTLLALPERTFCAKSMSDVEGGFELPHVRPGLFELRVYPARAASGRLEHGQIVRDGLAVAAGAGIDDLELRLPPGGTLDVLVVDAAGAPVVGAALRISDEVGDERWCEGGLRSDPDGRARLEGLRPGRWRVRTEAEGFVAREVWLDVAARNDGPSRVVLERAP